MRVVFGLVSISCLVAAILPATTGCGRSNPPQPTVESVKKSKSQQDGSAKTENRATRSSATDESANEWATETASEKLGKRLKQLAELLASPARITDASLSPLIHASFQCGHLRPDSLGIAFQDDAILVRRQVAKLTDVPLFKGASGLRTALRGLLDPLQKSTAIEASFKIVRINAFSSQWETTVFVSLKAPMQNKTIQQNATWRCRWLIGSQDKAPKLASITITDFEEAVGRGSPGCLFTDCTQSILGNNESFRQQLAFGLDHWLDRIETRFGIDISGWQGLAVADVNGDSLEDIYLCQGGGLPNRLFLQNQDGTARDVSADAGVDWRDHSQAAIFVDLDNDRDQDLVLGTALGLIIMANDGTGIFKTVAAKSIPEAPPLSVSAADFDNDGDLDIFAACYSVRGNNSQKHRFLGRPIPYHDANNGGRNVLFRNDGAWNFRDVTKSVGLHQNNRRFSMAAAWEDYDNDGDLDLYVANDYGRNNLYRNDNGQFTDIAAKAGVEDLSAGMSVSWGDFNRDGWMDLYVSNMFSSAGNRIAYQRRFQSTADDSIRAAFQRHARGNSLFLNSRDGSFQDASAVAGVTMGRWAWGSRFVDINNDGWEDIVVANGFITQSNPDDL